MPGDTGVKSTSFSIYFDENVQLEDAFSKVVVSPVQIQTPEVSANGKHVRVELKDTLVKGITYTIDFGDAIKDLNEGNVLDGFALDFSTGNRLDTLRVSGIVFDASNLEPAQGVMVCAYSNINDTAIHTIAPQRIARTNQYGQFTIRNLAPGSYRIYALNDLNRDYHWDRSEDAAFLDTLITPWVENITVTDTLYAADRTDSLISRSGRRFMPNDVLLMMFNQQYKAQYLKDYKRIDRRRALVQLAAEPDSMPEIKIVGGPLDGQTSDKWALHQYNQTRDSIVMWLRDSLVAATDSLFLSVRYQKPDSLDVLQWTTDTMRFFFHEPKKSKKELEADTLPPRFDLLRASVKTSTSHEVYNPIILTLDQPVERIDTAALHLEMMVDTIWEPLKLTLEPDSLDPVLTRNIRHKWEPGTKYRFSIDSAAIYSIFGEHNPPFKHEFTVKKLEEYSTLTFLMPGIDSAAIVELLSSSDSPIRSERVVDGKAIFRHLAPGKYYARMYFDDNGDGKWTTGLLDSIQPEEVAYYPKKLELKANWEVEQNWDIYETALDQQKPYAILKNKPKLKRGERDPRDVESLEEEEDELLGGPSGGNRGNSSIPGFGGGGFQKSNPNSNNINRNMR